MAEKYKETVERIKKEFVKEYKRIAPKSAKEFNLKRHDGVTGWATTAKLLGVKKWSELLNSCNLFPIKKTTVTKVRSIIDLEQKLKEMDKNG